jgi:hypothetical protein
MANDLSPRDSRVEALFQRWNLKWQFVPEFSLSDRLRVIDEAQVRMLTHVAPPERTYEYGIQMKGGTVFPPIVVMSPDVLLDGNTRVTAARQIGRDHFPAYVVDVPGIDFAKMLAAALNQMGGERLTSEEAYTAALHMMNSGWPDTSIGRELGHSADSVRRWRREAEFQDRTTKLSLGKWAQALTRKQHQDVAKIAHDEPFAEMVKLIADTKPDAAELKELFQTVEKAPSDADSMEAIHAARQSWVPVGPQPQKVVRNKTAQQMRMNLGALVKVLANPIEAYDPIGGAKDVERIREVLAGLQAVLALYEQEPKS